MLRWLSLLALRGFLHRVPPFQPDGATLLCEATLPELILPSPGPEPAAELSSWAALTRCKDFPPERIPLQLFRLLLCVTHQRVGISAAASLPGG